MKEGKALNFWVRGDIQQMIDVQNLGHESGELSPVPPLVANLDPPIKNVRRNVLGLITVIILKRLRESIFFQSNRYTKMEKRWQNL